jgi:Zn-dependent protease
MIDIQSGILWYLIFLFSTVFHEFAHAYTAMKMGDLTAYQNGQVTVNPIPHIKTEPIGTVVVPIISFLVGGWMIGWAKTPYDYEWAYENPHKSAAMSAAGPMSNFILVLFAAAVIHIGIFFGWFYSPETVDISTLVLAYNSGIPSSIASIISVVFSMNLILCIFNLIPLPPLDGSGILPMFMGEEKGRKYMDVISGSAFSFVGIFIAWKLFDAVYFKIHLLFVNLLYWGSNYH